MSSKAPRKPARPAREKAERTTNKASSTRGEAKRGAASTSPPARPSAPSEPAARTDRFARTLAARRASSSSAPPAPPLLVPSNEQSAVIPLPQIEFEVGELAVHPAHGVGTVASIEERDFGGTSSQVYVLHIVGSDLRVLVPKQTAARVGLRPVMSSAEADEILEVLATPEVAVTIQPWNRRFRAYTEMIASGSATEIAKVLRDMHRLQFDKDLSFGERRLLDQAKGLLVQELALAKKQGPEEMESTIAQIFAA